MPRFRFNPFVSRRESTPSSSATEELDPQAEWETKTKRQRRNEEEAFYEKIVTESEIYSRGSSRTTVPSLLSNIEEEVTNNSGNFEPLEGDCTPTTSTPISSRISTRPYHIDRLGDSGYEETERSNNSVSVPGQTSQTTDSLTGPQAIPAQPQSCTFKESLLQRDRVRIFHVDPPYGTVPNVITKVGSNTSRLNDLVHSKARLLVVNENLTLRSLKPDEDLADLLGTLDFPGKGVTVEELLENFSRVPMDRIHHFASVGEYLRSLHTEGRMIDVLLHVGGQTFAAHRVALACHSKYFADLFIHHDETTKLPVELTLTGMGPLAFQAFLRYVYTGEMIVSPESIGEVMAVSEKLSTPQIKAICSEYIEHIPCDQAMAILSSKAANTSSPVFKRAYKLVHENFCDVSDSDFFPKLSLELVVQLLSDDYLYVTSEMDVFWAGLKWVAYHITKRHNYISTVMKCVRFPLLSKVELFQTLEVTDLLRNSPPCREMVLRAMWMVTADEMGRVDPLKLPRPQPRMCMREDYVHQPQDTFRSIFEDDIGIPESETGRLLPVEDIPYHPRAESPVTMDSEVDKDDLTSDTYPVEDVVYKPGDILAIGCFQELDKDKNKDIKVVERYITNENQWKFYSELPEPRLNHAVAMLGGKLYLVGGSDPKKSKKNPAASNKAFKFDPAKGSWCKIGSLVTARMNHALCSLYGMLYAIGGQDDKSRVLCSVECYNPMSDTWHNVHDLITARSGFGACVCNGMIYVAGGFAPAADKRSNMPVISKFECYNPKFNLWTDLSPLSTGRCLCNLATVGNSIYLCAGATRADIKEDIRSVASIDVFNTKTNTWEYRTDLIKPRHNAGATVLGSKIYMIGGMSTVDNQTLQSIECYDTRTDCWDTSVQDMPYPAKSLGCVELPAHK